MDDFSNHPPTIGEQRLKREGYSQSWKPRDVLIDMLRQIDKGEVNPTHVILIYTDDEDELVWAQAGSQPTWAQMGMLERAKQLISDTAED